MDRVVHIASKLFENIFVAFGAQPSFLTQILNIYNRPLILIGIVMVIIGFAVSILKRIVHS